MSGVFMVIAELWELVESVRDSGAGRRWESCESCPDDAVDFPDSVRRCPSNLDAALS